MLSLDVKLNRLHAKDFKDKYLQILKDARDEVLKKKIQIDINKNGKKIKEKISASKNNKIFIREYLSDEHLESLINLKPIQQKRLIKIVKNRFSDIHKKEKNIYQFIKYIFITNGYEKLKTDEKKLFFNNLKINSCTYCNRNYIFNVEENGHIKGHIDHFYPKAKYPYLAMSFYNFIPVCESCNKVKSEYDTANKDKNIIHPYERKSEQVFDVSIDSVDDFCYKIESDDLLKDLHIEKIYNAGHKDIIQELYIKFFQENTKEHFDLLKTEFESLGFNDKDIYRYLTCSYLDNKEFHKRAFSKVTYDLMKDEFKVIK